MKSTNIFKAMALPLVAMAGSLLSFGAHAVPVSYSVVYSGTTGPGGTGSFSWDSASSDFSAFNWNFSPLADTLMANSWRSSIFGGTMGQFLFEILTGEDVHPSACSANSRCSFSTFNVQSASLSSVEFRTLGAGETEYLFRNGQGVLFSGRLSISRGNDGNNGNGNNGNGNNGNGNNGNGNNGNGNGNNGNAPGLAVSEPLSLSLLGVGLLGLAFVRRRRRV